MRREFQLKLPGVIAPSVLLGSGAEKLGQSVQKDIYLTVKDEVWRIRREADHYLLGQKGDDRGWYVRVKEVEERVISKKEADQIIKTHRVLAVICKNRILFRLGDSVITLDEVEQLGSFIEIRSPSEAGIPRILSTLGLRGRETIRESFLDMMLDKKIPAWRRALIRFHDRVGELIFGITSGILTTIGLLVGMNAATDSRLAVVAGILVIAMADSLSDSFGMYLSKLGERGGTRAAALRYASGTFAGKFIFPLSFAIPLLSPIALSTAVMIDLTWGAAVLALLSTEQALVTQTSVVRTIARNVGLAILIVCLSSLVGSIVPKLISSI